jgi:phosphate acetyltransferase
MRFIGTVIEKLQRHPKRLVFPEGEEPRVLQAARQFQALRLGVPILLGDRTRIKNAAAALGLSLNGIRIIDPASSEDLDSFAERYLQIRKERGITESEAIAAMRQPNYFGSMMVAMHQADGLVSGTSEFSGDVLRPLFRIIKMAPNYSTASSCMIMEVDDTRFGNDGVLFLADCGVIPDPTADQLAEIACSTGHLAKHLMGVEPRIAMLSYSTHGSARHASVVKVKQATELAAQRAKDLGLKAQFEGEIQADAAIVPDVADLKDLSSDVAGAANVLIFPDLNAGNIASKLLKHIARANAYGQILLGIDRPAADVSRGSNAHDVLGVAAIVGLQSIEYEALFPGAGQVLPGAPHH